VLCLISLIVVNTGFAGNSFNPKFNYQGKVIFNGSPANGDFQVDFNLYDVLSNGWLLSALLSEKGC